MDKKSKEYEKDYVRINWPVFSQLYLSTGKDSEPEVFEVRIWNDTVANLTLMALGSSAPEVIIFIY